MNSPTRLELDAAIDALEGRMEWRLQAIEKKIDDLIVRMDRFAERMTRFEERMTRFEEQMTRFEERLTRVENDCRETRAIASSLKLTIITTATASVVAIIIGFSAITSAMHTNMLSEFSAGKEDAALQEKMRRQADETDVLLREIRRKLDTTQVTKPDPVAH